jgi:hypothetical protein
MTAKKPAKTWKLETKRSEVWGKFREFLCIPPRLTTDSMNLYQQRRQFRGLDGLADNAREVG